jgi:hypothetical protein
MPIYRRLNRFNLMALITVALIDFAMTGGGTLQNGRGGSQDAISPVELKRIPYAAYRAFFDLQTLLPAAGAMTLLKATTNRTRPNGGNNSFPSGHSSDAFSSATLANRNLNSIKMSEEMRIPLQVGNIVLAAGVAWARVEAGDITHLMCLPGQRLGIFSVPLFMMVLWDFLSTKGGVYMSRRQRVER